MNGPAYTTHNNRFFSPAPCHHIYHSTLPSGTDAECWGQSPSPRLQSHTLSHDSNSQQTPSVSAPDSQPNNTWSVLGCVRPSYPTCLINDTLVGPPATEPRKCVLSFFLNWFLCILASLWGIQTMPSSTWWAFLYKFRSKFTPAKNAHQMEFGIVRISYTKPLVESKQLRKKLKTHLRR